MLNYILEDTPEAILNFRPFTFNRPVSHLRIGILKIYEKWQAYLPEGRFSYQSEAHLQAKYRALASTEDTLYLSSHILPNPALVQAINQLQLGEKLQKGDLLIAKRGLNCPQTRYFEGELQCLEQLTDLFVLNGTQIQSDFALLSKGRASQTINDPHIAIYGAKENIFIEEGAKLKACVLNAENGVIYIGKNAQVSEGSIVQGNFALGEGAVINPGSKMRGDTSIGEYCKVGGEISNSILIGFSNKGHEGFLGNSVLGEWCNLGADTNCSNLKNNYSNVKIWHYGAQDFVDTGRQFCGLMMGDHSKAGINTMFNTGTVVGVAANIFGGGFPPKHIPSFSWGGAEGFVTHQLEKALDTAEKVMMRRQKTLGQAEKAILNSVYEMTRPNKV